MVRKREIKLGNNKPTVIIHELDDIYDSLTGRVITGSWLWPSSFILSHFLSSLPTFTLLNKTILELGAGTGLPGLTATQLGAHRVILTDLPPLLPGLRHNVEVNGVRDRVEVCELVWGSDELPSQLSELGPVDFVLMSDVFYDPLLMPALAKTLKMVCGSETVVVSASEVRDSTAECLIELVNHGFEVSELTSQVSRHELCGVDDCCIDDEYAVYHITFTPTKL